MKLTKDTSKFPNDEEVEKGCIHKNFYRSHIKNHLIYQCKKLI